MFRLERLSKSLGLAILLLSTLLLNSCSLKKPGLSVEELQNCFALAQDINN